MFFFSRPPREGARGGGDVAENIQSHLPQLLPPTFASPLPPPFLSKTAIRFHFLLESHHRAKGRKGGGRGRNKSRRGLKCTLSSEEGDWKSNNDCRSLFEFRTQRILLLSLRLCLRHISPQINLGRCCGRGISGPPPPPPPPPPPLAAGLPKATTLRERIAAAAKWA